MCEPSTSAGEIKPLASPQLYNMLLAPVRKSSSRHARHVPAAAVEPAQLTWERMPSKTNKDKRRPPSPDDPTEQHYRIPHDERSRPFILQSTTASSRTKRQRKAAYYPSEEDQQSQEATRAAADLESIGDYNNLHVIHPPPIAFPSTSRKVRTPASTTTTSDDGPNLRSWRVKKVLTEHGEMLRSLSKSAINNVPPKVFELGTKQRCTAKDRETVLLYQEQMRELLTQEYNILQQLQLTLRNAVYR